jgi:hypothetical protein
VYPDQHAALSRLKSGFESRRGHSQFQRQVHVTGGALLIAVTIDAQTRLRQQTSGAP